MHTIFIIFLNRVVFCLLLFVVCFRHISCVTNVFVISLVWPMLSLSLHCFRHISCVTNVGYDENNPETLATLVTQEIWRKQSRDTGNIGHTRDMTKTIPSYLLCDQCCQCLWMIHIWLHLRFLRTFSFFLFTCDNQNMQLMTNPSYMFIVLLLNVCLVHVK
jgi:hypothetical protein